jgi:hypothetical protein
MRASCDGRVVLKARAVRGTSVCIARGGVAWAGQKK